MQLGDMSLVATVLYYYCLGFIDLLHYFVCKYTAFRYILHIRALLGSLI